SAQLGGPGLAGLIVDLLSAPVAIVFDALSFLGSAVLIFRIRKAEPPQTYEAGVSRRMRDEIAEGLRYVLGHPYLKNIAACTATFNFFGSLWSAVLLVYAVRVLDLRPAVIGLAFTISNVGALLAAFTAGRISTRVGVGRTIVGASVLGGPMFLVAAFAPHGIAALAVLGPAMLVGAFSNVLYNVTQVSLRQTITPGRIQGRMNSVMRFIVWGTIPLGALVGGALGTWLGLKETLIIGGIGCCLPFLPVLFSPVRSIGDMPEPFEDEAVPLDPLVGDAAALTLEQSKV
ncbi:MAG: hypothetical protein QOF43_1450, partial [Gaiellaceae bacterium]|nr:hypothetical protein [Gaiellaceae bacterium]